jgi:hypothetical protein
VGKKMGFNYMCERDGWKREDEDRRDVHLEGN